MDCTGSYAAEMVALTRQPLDDQAYIGDTIISRDALEFLDNLRSPPFDNGRWIFRGQSDERWLL